MPKEFTVNIDSRNRPSQSQSITNFSIKFDNVDMMKGIIGVKLSSAEISNSFSIVNSDYNNNYFRIHLPNKNSDPDGWPIILDKGVPQTQEQYANAINKILNDLFNTNKSLAGGPIPGPTFTEKYLYIFNVVNSIDITYYFVDNNNNQQGPYNIILNSDWYSLYGIVRQIKNKITDKYHSNFTSNIMSSSYCNFIIIPFTIPIFDRRFRYCRDNYDLDPETYTKNDCIRFDNLPYAAHGQPQSFNFNNNDLSNNLESLKTAIYKCYYSDVSGINIQHKQDTPQPYNGILDDLKSGTYVIPDNYLNGGDNINNYLQSYSIYHINNDYIIPKGISTQIYNIAINYNPSLSQFSFTNSFNPEVNPKNTFSNTDNDFYFYYIDATTQGWNPDTTNNFTNGDNIVTNLTDLDELYDYKFVTDLSYSDVNYIPSTNNDIPDFVIDFTNGYPNLSNKEIKYRSVGSILGFNDTNNNAPIMDNTFNYKVLYATNINQLYGSFYINLRLGTGSSLDWGAITLLGSGSRNLAKILLPPYIAADYSTYSSATSIINPVYYFPKPNKISQINNLNVQLTDNYNNILNANGVDFSFTIVFILEDNNKSF